MLYWGREWTPQLFTTTLYLQLVGTSRCQCKETLQLHNIVSIDRRYLIFMGLSLIQTRSVSTHPTPILVGVKERSLPFQSSDKQPTQSLCQADILVLPWVVLFQRSSPPPNPLQLCTPMIISSLKTAWAGNATFILQDYILYTSKTTVWSNFLPKLVGMMSLFTLGIPKKVWISYHW